MLIKKRSGCIDILIISLYNVKNINKGLVEMTILKEKEVMHPLYTAKLENGVCITVFGDYGKGDDEKIYYHVGKDVDGVLQTVGWSCDISKAVIL